MDLNVAISLLSMGIAAFAIYIARKEVQKDIDQDIPDNIPRVIPPVVSSFNNDGHEYGIDVVKNILNKHGVYKKHISLVDSMVLITMSKKNTECNLDLLIQADDWQIIEFGRMYIDRFAKNPTKLDYFLSGVIETEMNNIRTGSKVPLQDIHELRKIVDSFYYKNI